MITNDDSRLTAYALGELNDADRAAFEAELAEMQTTNPAAKAAVDAEIESIRAVAMTLTGELKAEVDVASGSHLRLSSGEERERGAHATKPKRRVARWALAAAAAVVVGGLAFSIFAPSLNRAREVAGDKQFASELRQIGMGTSLSANESKSDQPKTGWKVDAGKAVVTEAQLDGSIAGGKDKEAKVDYAANPFVGVQRDSLVTNKAPSSPKPATPGLLNASSGFVSSPYNANDTILIPLDDDDEVLASREPFLRRIQDKARSTTSTESYAAIHDNAFLDPRSSPLSTFGIDVDTASYSNIRRYLESGQRPPADAVRIEELINYFPTHDAPPTDGRPFAVRMEVAACPWAPEHRLVRVALKGHVIAKEARPPSNLVFLIDVSGSMNQPNKLPLVKRSLRKLVGQLGENDRVAIVVYAGSSGLALPSTNASDKTTILAAIDKLEAGGSTNGGQGIELAYTTALQHMAKDGGGSGGSNRVILCTDGDFNVGVVDRGQLFNLIAEKAKAGVFLNVLGFGTGNTKDDTMEGLADKGNGQYGYIDSDREADKVFVEGLSGTLVTIAKDVKLQLEFNPGAVKSYRLIGYENRVMAAQDFNNDLKDSGDLGAGHNVVALYEIDPARGGVIHDPAKTEPTLKYQPQPQQEATRLVTPGANTTELLTLKLRYKRPDAPLEQGTSELIETTLEDRADASIGAASDDMRFAAAVAGFGMMLRDSPDRGACTWDLIRSLARGGIGDDVGGHRSEFLNLIDTAQKTN